MAGINPTPVVSAAETTILVTTGNNLLQHTKIFQRNEQKYFSGRTETSKLSEFKTAFDSEA